MRTPITWQCNELRNERTDLSLGEDIIRKKHILARDFLPNPGEKTGHHKPTSQRHEQCFFVPRKHKRKRGVNELRNLHEIYGQGTPRKYSNLAQEQRHMKYLTLDTTSNQSRCREQLFLVSGLDSSSHRRRFKEKRPGGGRTGWDWSKSCPALVRGRPDLNETYHADCFPLAEGGGGSR
jgi:hypothetical protein